MQGELSLSRAMSKKNTLEDVLANPPHCPSCRGNRMKRKWVEKHELLGGGTVHWQCPVCDFKLISSFE